MGGDEEINWWEMKDEGAGEIHRIASEAKHGKSVPSVEYDEDCILDT